MNKYKNKKYVRGDVFMIDLIQNDNIQGGLRPCVIVQNNYGNTSSPNLVVVPVTSRYNKSSLPTHVWLKNDLFKVTSMAMCETILTVSKSKIISYLGRLEEEDIKKINKALMIELDLFTKKDIKEKVNV